MSQYNHHSKEAAAQYRTVARKANGPYVVIANWSTFEKALGCSFGFYAAEKILFDMKKGTAQYFNVFVQRRDPSAGFYDWTTIAGSMLRLDFDHIVKKSPKPRQFKSGELCDAVLLEQKTRRGGWIAAISGVNCEGPITNSGDVPAEMVPGMTVKLKIGAIDQKANRVQFTWTNART